MKKLGFFFASILLAFTSTAAAMEVNTSLQLKNGDHPELTPILEKIAVSESDLRDKVKALAKPRHFIKQPDENKKAGEWLKKEMEKLGLRTEFQGEFRNVVGLSPNPDNKPWVLLGAHYDSVAESAGADDNASGVVAVLEIARILREQFPEIPVAAVGFNAEEIADHSLPEEQQTGLHGSGEFFSAVKNSSLAIGEIGESHIFEMVGYTGDKQRSLEGVPPFLNPPGNFVAILCDLESAEIGKSLLECAAADGDNSPYYALTLTVPREAAQAVPDLARSDHYSGWINGFRATMVTDTAEFRNEHYHTEFDRPETLNFEFLGWIIEIHAASIGHRKGGNRK